MIDHGTVSAHLLAMQARIDGLEERIDAGRAQARAEIDNVKAERDQYRRDFEAMSARASELSGTVSNLELHVEAVNRALDRCVDDKQRLATQLDAKTVAIREFAEAVARAESALLSRGRGGQQVSFHGDFAGANPGVLLCLGRWVTLLQGGDS